MNVFVAGATGAIGKPLVAQLVAAGHTVTATTRLAQHVEQIRALGAEPTVVDALDRAAVVEAVKRAEPEVIIHEMTALTHLKSFKNFDRDFAMTNRLRTEGTDYLLEGAQAAGTRRFIIQSYGGWIFAPTGSQLKTEEDALDPNPPARQTQSLAAIRYLEQAAQSVGIEGIALRYGNLYGPGTGFASDGVLTEMVRKRLFPIIGSGAGVWSFIHVDDAASATIAAMLRGTPGIYNIVDDEPAPVRVWLPEYARAVGAQQPMRIPLWVGRLVAGEAGVSVMTRIHGASNAKAKRELGWTPGYASWRDGFKGGLG